MELAVDHRTPSLSTPPSRPEAGRRTRPEQSDALRDVLAELGERVKPITLARERTLPVAAPFDRLLPDDGMVRGRVLSCRGVADTSLAFGLISEALAAGAWAAMVDVATFGADAASEFGIPLERIVRVESGSQEAERSAGVGAVASWIDVMGAAIDGFDVVVTKVPAELHRAGQNRAGQNRAGRDGAGRNRAGRDGAGRNRAGRDGAGRDRDVQSLERRPAALRKLATRVQQKGAIVVVIGETGALSSDLVFSTEHTGWSGVTNGAGHLRSRVINVAAGGRRLPGARTVSLLVEGGAGRAVCSLAPAAAVGSETDLVVDLAEYPGAERDPQAELLAEMADNLEMAEDVADTVVDDDHRLAG